MGIDADSLERLVPHQLAASEALERHLSRYQFAAQPTSGGIPD